MTIAMVEKLDNPTDLKNTDEDKTLAIPEAAGPELAGPPTLEPVLAPLLPAPPDHTSTLMVTLQRCSLCKCAVLEEEIRQHTADHFGYTGEEKFTCEECGASYSSRDLLHRHKWGHKKQKMRKVKVKVEKKVHKCETCGKIEPGLYKLKVHEAKHTGAKNFTCELCGKLFTHPGSVTTHKKNIHKIPLN